MITRIEVILNDKEVREQAARCRVAAGDQGIEVGEYRGPVFEVGTVHRGDTTVSVDLGCNSGLVCVTCVMQRSDMTTFIDSYYYPIHQVGRVRTRE